jgi:rhamnosyltransferase
MLEPIHEPGFDSPPGISVVVPVLDGGAGLTRLLARLSNQRAPDGVEIIVVDSGSRDRSVDRAVEAGARVFRTTAFGHGRTRNEALERACAPLIVLMTQDALPREADFLTTLCQPLVDDDTLAGTWARQLPKPGTDPLVEATLSRWCPSGEESRQRAFELGEYESMTPLARAVRCRFDNVASCVRRSVWREHPFPEVPFGEDTAWAKRVLLAGYDLLYSPRAEVFHAHESGPLTTFRRDHLAHALLASEFGLRTVRSPVGLGLAWLAGWHSDLRDLGGVSTSGKAAGLLRGAARRAGALAGQYTGGRVGSRRPPSVPEY